MNISTALIFSLGFVSASCSHKSSHAVETDSPAAPAEITQALGSKDRGRGEERQPDQDQIEQDCAAFVRATEIVPAQRASTDCPSCAAEGIQVLNLRGVITEAVSCSRDTCSVTVTIRAMFNPGTGENLRGGLTGWIPPDKRSAYLRGQTPEGEQAFRVQITYKLRGAIWHAVDFDRAPAA